MIFRYDLVQQSSSFITMNVYFPETWESRGYGMSSEVSKNILKQPSLRKL